jgi:N-methylhydantoinase A
MAWRIGVDSRGTFTDICLSEEKSGHIAVWRPV